MSYAVISEWVSKNSRRSAEGQAQEQAAKEKFAPGVMALGAKAVYFIYTSDTTFNVVTIYQDEATATNAAEKQRAIRAQASTELPVSMTGEVRGEVFASS